MTKNCLYWLVAASALSFTACKKDEAPPTSLGRDRSEVNLPGYINAFESISITGDAEWTLTMSPAADWLELSSSKGKGPAKIQIKNIKEYNSTSTPVTLTLSAADGSVPATTIKITQKAYFQKLLSKLDGTTQSDYHFASLATNDGGVIMVGTTEANSAEGGFGANDGYIVKYNSNGEVQWRKKTGGSLDDICWAIAATTDGQYVVAGSTKSNNGDIPGTWHGKMDYWVMKISAAGEITWSKSYGGSENDEARGIAALPDGGCLVTGTTQSIDFEVGGTASTGGARTWTIVLNKDGNIVRKNTITDPVSSLAALNLVPTKDGNFLLTGNKTNPSNRSQMDGWIVKLNAEGGYLWQKSFGTNTETYITSALATEDGGYLLAGKSSINGETNSDIRVIKTDGDGNLVWDKMIGGSDAEEGGALAAAADGGFYLAGATFSTEFTQPTHQEGDDGWLVKLDAKGNKQWMKTFGSTMRDGFYTIARTTDHKYFIGGYSGGNDDDVSGNHGQEDAWIFKFE